MHNACLTAVFCRVLRKCGLGDSIFIESYICTPEQEKSGISWAFVRGSSVFGRCYGFDRDFSVYTDCGLWEHVAVISLSTVVLIQWN